ncbi:unnamed protein product, partial [marine sediment metagenome]
GPVMNNTFRMDWNATEGLLPAQLPRMWTRLNPIDSDVKYLVGLYLDDNNYIAFRADTGISPNWKAVCRVGGAETEVDTGIPLADAKISLEMITISAGEVRFNVDGVLKATIDTNVPAVALQAFLKVETLGAFARWLDVDAVVITSGRV